MGKICCWGLDNCLAGFTAFLARVGWSVSTFVIMRSLTVTAIAIGFDHGRNVWYFHRRYKRIVCEKFTAFRRSGNFWNIAASSNTDHNMPVRRLGKFTFAEWRVQVIADIVVPAKWFKVDHSLPSCRLRCSSPISAARYNTHPAPTMNATRAMVAARYCRAVIFYFRKRPLHTNSCIVSL